MTLDVDGTLWVTNPDFGYLWHIAPNLTILVTFRLSYISELYGISFLPNGNLLAVDALGNQVAQVLRNGSFVSYISPTVGSFNRPLDVVVDAEGTAYISDLRNDRVVVVMSNGSQSNISVPFAAEYIALEVNAVLYIASAGNTVAKVSIATGAVVQTFTADVAADGYLSFLEGRERVYRTRRSYHNSNTELTQGLTGPMSRDQAALRRTHANKEHKSHKQALPEKN